MKKCSGCDEVKPIEEFNKDKTSKGGKCYHCKICSSERNNKHRRSLKGKAMAIYSSQRHSSKKRGHEPPKYTKEEFLNWILCNEKYLKLYEQWRGSGYNKMLSPSCDRLDDYKGYNFDNIQVVTWGENKIKGHSDIKNGLNNKINKPVIKMDLNGVELESYYSISQASRETGIYKQHIWRVCNGERKSTRGFRWKYTDRN